LPVVSRSNGAKLLAAVAAAGLLLTPAIAAGEGRKRAPAVSVSFDPISTFTPARTPSSEFKFTPAAAKSRPSQVRVAIRARADSPSKALLASGSSASPVSAINPTSYNLGVGIGWRRFAVSGDVAQLKSGTPGLGGRETALVGVSYSVNNRLTGRVAAGVDRDDGRALTPLRNPDNYSLDVGGAYAVTKRLAVTGGVRYRIDRDRVAAVGDDRRDSQAVYVGTAFKF
jgi:hypothetical protein